MTCHECQDECWGLLDGTLKARDVHKVLRHALECPSCEESLREDVRLQERLYGAGSTPVSDSLVKRICAGLPPPQRERIAWEGWKIAAAVFIAVVSTIFFLTADTFEEIRLAISRETSHASEFIEAAVADSSALFRSENR